MPNLEKLQVKLHGIRVKYCKTAAEAQEYSIPLLKVGVGGFLDKQHWKQTVFSP